MILVVDNSKDLSTAQMTPKLIHCLVQKSRVPVVVASSKKEVRACLALYRPTGVILSGGPLLLTQRTMMDHYSQNIMALLYAERHRLPVLGICFGMQVMAASYGGQVSSMRSKIHGKEWVLRTGKSLLLGPDRVFEVIASHQDRVVDVPIGFRVTSRYRSTHDSVQSMEDPANLRFGLQFHPEGNREGHEIIRRFLRICAVHSQKQLT